MIAAIAYPAHMSVCVCVCVCSQTVNTFVITAKECTRALNEQRALERPGLRTTVLNAWDASRVHWRMTLLSTFAWLAQLRGSLASRTGWLIAQ